MRVLRPTPMADAMLISTSAVNADADYNAATSYALNASCTYKRRIYKSLQAANVGHAPDVSSTWWVNDGPCNKWAMFDSEISTATTASNALTFTVATGMLDTIALVGIVTNTARVVVRNGLAGEVVYDRTQSFSVDEPTEWYAYFFFDELTRATQGVYDDIPPYANAYVTVTLASGVGVSLGVVTFGLSSNIGAAQYGATAGIIDYSRKDTDQFGITSFVERAYSKRMTVSLTVDNLQLNRVQRLLYSVRAKPCLWIGVADQKFSEALTIYGFYRDFTATIAYPTTSLYSLEIEGLT